MSDKLMKIFEIMSFYDKHRWSSKDSYNLINFSRDDLDNDSKLLTHWLCYITDRQMPFKIVWDIGGFVLSDLVYNIKKNSMRMDEPLKLLDPGRDDSFIGKDAYSSQSPH